MRAVALLCEGPHDEAVVLGLLENLLGQLPPRVGQAGEYRWTGISLSKAGKRATRQFRRKCGEPPHKDAIRVLELARAVWTEQDSPDTVLIVVRDRDRDEARCRALEWAGECLEGHVAWGCAVECIEAWVLVRCSLDRQAENVPNAPHRLAPRRAKGEVRRILGDEANREGYRRLFAAGYDLDELAHARASEETGLGGFVRRLQATLFTGGTT